MQTRVITGLLLIACLLAVPACVTVTEGGRGIPLPKNGERAKKAEAKSASKSTTTKGREPERTVQSEQLPSLPDGQIADRAAGATLTSRVQVAVVPLGVVEYDGQTLPLVSPDGRFIAVQQGMAPAWETVLAQDSAPLAKQTRVAIYQFTPQGLQLVEPVEVLPDGLLLGRDATNEYFLVEQQRADGARWIATIDWASGAARWIAQGRDINAHGVFVPLADGEAIAYTRRRLGTDDANLVLRSRNGDESTASPSSGTFAFPMPSTSRDVIFATQVSFDGVSLVTFAASRAGSVKLTGPLSSRRVTDSKELFTAYQMFAPLQPSVTVGQATDEPTGLFIHPSRGRAALFSPKPNTMANLPSQTIAAARYDDASNRGYFATSPQGLIFVPDATLGSDDQYARVFAGPYVARCVQWESQPTLVLFGPDKRNSKRLELLRMRVK